jgi:hypothetical protein
MLLSIHQFEKGGITMEKTIGYICILLFLNIIFTMCGLQKKFWDGCRSFIPLSSIVVFFCMFIALFIESPYGFPLLFIISAAGTVGFIGYTYLYYLYSNAEWRKKLWSAACVAVFYTLNIISAIYLIQEVI